MTPSLLPVVAGTAGALGWAAARMVTAGQLRRARAAAECDPLTGVSNRAGLTAHAPRVLAAGPVGVVLLDLTGFKVINDAHGHEAGDQVLVATAARLAGVVGAGGVVARLGGDEFTALVRIPPPVAVGGGEAMVSWLTDWARTTHQALTRPVPVAPGRLVPVGVSIGATITTPGAAFPLALAAADAAMYTARTHGQAVWVSPPEHPVPVPTPRPAARRRDHTSIAHRAARSGSTTPVEATG